MRSKAPLALMEQLVMVLVFALAAAVCLRAFLLSDQLSARSERRAQALSAAQSAAEELKSCRGDTALAASRFGGTAENGVWITDWDAAGHRTETDARYRVALCVVDSGESGLGEAALTACDMDGETLWAFSVAWQEEVRADA